MRNTPEYRARRAAYMRAYMADPERRAAKRIQDRAYGRAHAAEAIARARAWVQANPERAKATQKAHHERTKVLVGRPTGERHRLWKGEDVSYHALHHWLARVLGKPSKCEKCRTTTAKRFEWANIDHEYRRDTDDWMRLCTSCHRRYDIASGIARPGGPR